MIYSSKNSWDFYVSHKNSININTSIQKKNMSSKNHRNPLYLYSTQKGILSSVMQCTDAEKQIVIIHCLHTDKYWLPAKIQNGWHHWLRHIRNVECKAPILHKNTLVSILNLVTMRAHIIEGGLLTLPINNNIDYSFTTASNNETARIVSLCNEYIVFFFFFSLY